MCHQGSYKLHGKFKSYKSASRVRTKIIRSREVMHIQCSGGISTNNYRSAVICFIKVCMYSVGRQKHPLPTQRQTGHRSAIN